MVWGWGVMSKRSWAVSIYLKAFPVEKELGLFSMVSGDKARAKGGCWHQGGRVDICLRNSTAWKYRWKVEEMFTKKLSLGGCCKGDSETRRQCESADPDHLWVLCQTWGSPVANPEEFGLLFPKAMQNTLTGGRREGGRSTEGVRASPVSVKFFLNSQFGNF